MTRKNALRATKKQREEAAKRIQQIAQEFHAKHADTGTISMQSLQEAQEIVDEMGGCIKVDIDGDDALLEFMFCSGTKPRIRHTQKKTPGGVILPHAVERGIVKVDKKR